MSAMTAAGGIGIIPRETSWIIATTAHPIAPNPVVAVELGTAVAAVVAAATEAAGTAAKKWRRRKYKDRGESMPVMVYFTSR